MSNRQVWIVVGVSAAVLAFGYLATKREINATVTMEEASITYFSTGGGGGTVPTGSSQPIP
jgi:hypothetical protein